MRILSIILFVTGVIAGFYMLTVALKNNSIKETVVESVNQDPKIEAVNVQRQQVLGWIPYWDQVRAVKSFTNNVETFDYISLFWYYIDTKGRIAKYGPVHEDRSIIDFAHANNVKVLVLIANLPDTGGGSWDSTRVNRVIDSRESRQSHVEDIVQLIDRYNFDGVNIDYEVLQKSQKDNFTVFIKELSEALHQKGKIVSVALHPKTTEGKSSETNGSEAQDWKELGKYADQLHLMTYEQHTASTGPGPSAESSWSKRVTAYAKKLIPADKIYFGIGLYGYDWPEDEDGKVRGLTNTQVDQIITKENPDIDRDEDSAEPNFVYENGDGQRFEVWYNDQESVKRRLQFAKDENLGGVAFWRLGGEDSQVWNLFDSD